jgi:hypothetical protein
MAESETAEKKIQNPVESLLPLDLSERAVTWKNAQGEVRAHIFRRIGDADWRAYFAAISIERDRESQTIDFTTAALTLYERCALRTRGYAVAGGAQVETLARWKDRLPMGHRIQAVDLLIKVEKHEGRNMEIEPELETVALDAFWGIRPPSKMADAPPGMLKYSGLLHRFAPPTAEYAQRFARETSRTVIVPGSRTGRTIYPVREKILLNLYDELIRTVEGYGVDGKALVDREAIVREMDGFHKVAAVGCLFSRAGEEEAEETL